MYRPHSARRTAVAAVAALTAAAIGLVSACSASTEPPTAALQSSAARAAASAHDAHARATPGDLSAAQKQAVARVRQATARFHDRAVATAAGYAVQYPAGCAVDPLGAGAQAFHFLNTARVDATVDLLHPELLMYEPGPDGTLHLVGVDYIVPLAAAATAPSLLGVPFMRNEPLGVWALHIWAWRPNPSGLFAAWNPAVSCAHAGAVVLD